MLGWFQFIRNTWWPLSCWPLLPCSVPLTAHLSCQWEAPHSRESEGSLFLTVAHGECVSRTRSLYATWWKAMAEVTEVWIGGGGFYLYLPPNTKVVRLNNYFFSKFTLLFIYKTSNQWHHNHTTLVKKATNIVYSRAKGCFPFLAQDLFSFLSHLFLFSNLHLMNDLYSNLRRINIVSLFY